jgi:hypothetical protein
MKYRILRPSDQIRYGDERWDFELGWTKIEDPHMERFSKEYRRAGDQAWQFRRPLTTTKGTAHERE